MRARLVVGLLWLLALSACSAPAPDPRIAAARDYVKEVTGDDLKVGGLRVSVSDVATDGRTAHIRGKLVNGYSSPVSGVRYVVTLLAPNTGRVLDTYRRQVDTTLDVGESKRVTLDVTSTYLSGVGSFSVAATPVKLGGADVPPPPDWK